MSSDATTRQYLEQMMVRFVALRVPVDEAALELVEIEAHIAESDDDPFETLGPPHDLATSLIEERRRLDLYREGLRQDLILGVIFGAAVAMFVQGVLSVFGIAETQVPRLVVYAVLFAFWGAGQFSFARILTGIADDDSSLRLRGAAQVCLVGFVGAGALTLLLVFAGADLSGDAPFEQSSWWWFGIFAFTAVVGSVFAFRSWRLRGQEHALIEGGVTGQILYDMNHNGFSKGWVRYGVDGTDLRDPNFSYRAEFKKVKDSLRVAVDEADSQ